MTYTADRLRAFGYRFVWEPDWSLSTSHADHYGPKSAYEGEQGGEPETCEEVVLYDNHGSIVGSLGCIDDADDDYRAQVEDELAAEVTFPDAKRSSVAEARQAFALGQLVLISDNGLHRTTYALGPWTQTHDKTRITWEELDGMRRAWGKPQRYYIVPGAQV
jgi:hypothetical protein